MFYDHRMKVPSRERRERESAAMAMNEHWSLMVPKAIHSVQRLFSRQIVQGFKQLLLSEPLGYHGNVGPLLNHGRLIFSRVCEKRPVVALDQCNAW